MSCTYTGRHPPQKHGETADYPQARLIPEPQATKNQTKTTKSDFSFQNKSVISPFSSTRLWVLSFLHLLRFESMSGRSTDSHPSDIHQTSSLEKQPSSFTPHFRPLLSLWESVVATMSTSRTPRRNGKPSPPQSHSSLSSPPPVSTSEFSEKVPKRPAILIIFFLVIHAHTPLSQRYRLLRQIPIRKLIKCTPSPN